METEKNTQEQTTTQEKATPKKKKKSRPWLRVLIKFIVAGVFVALVLCFFQFHSIHDNAMFPSLRDGSLIITANFLNYSYNDVVAYKVQDESGKEKVRFGRIMCLGGNELELAENGDVLVNGVLLDTNSFYENYDIGKLEYPIFIPDNAYYIMQDYRVENQDSRTYGAISKQDIVGKVIFSFQIRGF